MADEEDDQESMPEYEEGDRRSATKARAKIQNYCLLHLRRRDCGAARITSERRN